MSYSDTLATDLDKVRFHIGDTSNVAATELLTNGEIAYLLSVETNVYRAAAMAAESIASKMLIRAESVSVGDTSISYGDQAAKYQTLAKTLRAMGGRRGSAPAFLGGVSIADRDTRESDTDRVDPFFTRHAPGDDRRIDELTRDYVR